ncbi:hypothetical protein O7605_09710 [Verrucosispora sp. WMMA2121]|uniref:hypothetical protein n=1 Tax=Verrucosispora sp. WMMA2121 TaxID=3015164 RepID=UPI0022B709CE|nr:hypothetical protein [Verrucosispora sp. WMMA2121]MCZ7419791.1 hypothetical protein [Verrucosispora sp. WMMA2121]
MTNRSLAGKLPPTFTRRTSTRLAGMLAGLALGAALLAGCSSEGASTDCGLDACTVTFDGGVDARANILGVEARLVETQDDVATIEVAGEQLSLTVGQQAADVGGLAVTLDSVTDSEVKVRIARNGG